jgi:PBP1b-binding outer membrane lipoprotein LpoB
MRGPGFFRIIALTIMCLVLTCCSGSKDTEQKAKESNRTATEQTVEAVKEYGKKPMDKARAAQQMGEERTQAMDEAVKRQ